MRAIVDDPIPKPSEVASVPPELEAIVMRALRKRRDARFATAGEMAEVLERYALTHDEFSPSQVGGYMKGLFRTEFLQWRKTATAALDMELDQPPEAVRDGQLSGVEPPTMALRPGMSWSRGGSELRSVSPADRARESSASRPRGSAPARTIEAPVTTPPPPQPVAQAPSRRDRIWVYGGLAVLAAVGGAGIYLLFLARNPSPWWQKLAALRQGAQAVALPLPSAPPILSTPETRAQLAAPGAPSGIVSPPPVPAAPASAPAAQEAPATEAHAVPPKMPIRPAKPRPRRRAARADAVTASAERPTAAQAEKAPEKQTEKPPEKADPFQ
jgi:hypothetical protein